MSLDDEAEMARFQENLKSKLSTINETQAAINTVGDWIMFHWRKAERGAQLWFDRLKDSNTSKRLALIYLVNEVAQNAKNRGKLEVNNAFAPFIPTAFQTAYSTSPTDTQKRLKYVVQIWRERQTFDPAVIEALDSKLKEVDESRLKTRRPLGGGGGGGNNEFGANGRPGGSAPPGLEPTEGKYVAVMRAKLSHRPAVSKVNSEYEQLVVVERMSMQPTVHSARLGDLLKTLSSAADAVAATMETREQLFAELDKVLQGLRAEHEADEKALAGLRGKEPNVRARREKVEHDLLLGVSESMEGPQQQHQQQQTAVESIEAPSNPFALQGDGSDNGDGEDELEKPQVEPLTPPPAESFTPPLPTGPDPGGDVYGDIDMVNHDNGSKFRQRDSLNPPGLPPTTTIPALYQLPTSGMDLTNPHLGPPPPPPSDPRLALPNITANPSDPRLKRMRPSSSSSEHQTSSNGAQYPSDLPISAIDSPNESSSYEGYPAPQGSAGSFDGEGGNGPKRRKSSHSSYQHHEKHEFEDFLRESGGDAMEGIDADVVGMLR